MKTTIFFFLLTISLTSFSQNITIKNANNQQPVPNAMIYDGNSHYLTNKAGQVTLKDSINTDNLSISANGYSTKLVKKAKINSDSIIITLQPDLFEIDEVVISANRWEQRSDEIPISIMQINVNNLDFNNPQTSADLLGTNSRVFIQKSQLGGGSPMIRGFAANRVLIVLDGVRMNNAIFRSGNLQNIISIDPNSIAQAEVVFGTGSVIYGSDAIGGVMDFHTSTPTFSNNSAVNFKLSSLVRYSSANNENTANINFNIGLKRFAFYTNLSYSKFNDLMMGSVGNEDYTRPEYATQINRIDTVVPNTNPNIQRFSGYDTKNFMQKISFKASDHTSLNYSFYYSTTSDVPRYDRLIQYKKGKLKYAQWYYGPQTYMMHNFLIENNSKTKLWDNFRLTFAYQDYTESRHDRKFGKTDIRERTENVKIGSINLDAYKELSSKFMLFYGIESTYDLVSSTGQKRDITTNETTPYASRYPDGTTYQNADIYTQLKYNINDNLILNIGARFSQIFLNATFDTTFYNFPFQEANLSPRALTGSSGIVYSTNNDWNFSFNIATGFRAPNVDDIGKIFDSEPGNVIVPNANLKPEKIYDADFGVHKTASHYFVNASVFYSYLDNAMVRSDFSFNGQDSIMYDGTMSKVQALVNADYAIIYGIQADAGVQFLNFLLVKTGYSYIKGSDAEGNSVRHVPPAYGNTHIVAFSSKFKADLYANYNAEITNDNLAPSEQDKPYLYATDVNGNPYCPNWWTLNLKFQYKLGTHININAGIENILDVRYRPYSSGIVSAGRNFIVSLKMKI